MQASMDASEFEKAWKELAEVVCLRIYKEPEVQEMKKTFDAKHSLTYEQKSAFISIANRIKYEVIHERFGADGSPEYEAFKKAWEHWFDNKQTTSKQFEGRRLTNAEHVLFSSTPNPEEFLSNFEAQ